MTAMTVSATHEYIVIGLQSVLVGLLRSQWVSVVLVIMFLRPLNLPLEESISSAHAVCHAMRSTQSLCRRVIALKTQDSKSKFFDFDFVFRVLGQ